MVYLPYCVTLSHTAAMQQDTVHEHEKRQYSSAEATSSHRVALYIKSLQLASTCSTSRPWDGCQLDATPAAQCSAGSLTTARLLMWSGRVLVPTRPHGLWSLNSGDGRQRTAGKERQGGDVFTAHCIIIERHKWDEENDAAGFYLTFFFYRFHQ